MSYPAAVCNGEVVKGLALFLQSKKADSIEAIVRQVRSCNIPLTVLYEKAHRYPDGVEVYSEQRTYELARRTNTKGETVEVHYLEVATVGLAQRDVAGSMESGG